MTVLPYLTAIRFSGTDAGIFLHNQLSADVLALSNGSSTFACYCEPKGRVLSLMLVCRVAETYYIIMSSELSQVLADRLKIYVMRSKVMIEVLRDQNISGLQQGVAPELASATLLAIPLPDKQCWLTIGGSDTAPDPDHSLLNEWKTNELKLGISWLNAQSSGQFLPQMLGFDKLGAVNFRKGCYPGQEIVARTHYLGKVKRHPRLLRVAGSVCPNPLDKIQILSADTTYEATVADSTLGADGDMYIFVVTRMDPALSAEQIELGGEIETVI